MYYNYWLSIFMGLLTMTRSRSLTLVPAVGILLLLGCCVQLYMIVFVSSFIMFDYLL